MSPACTARVGPVRASVSAPLRKSKRSFARLLEIWMRSAHTSATRIGTARKTPCPAQYAAPSASGATAAGSVLGRTARSQGFGGLGLGVIGSRLPARGDA